VNRVGLLIGIGFGFLLAASRLNDYTVIHDMLLLREPDVFLLMGSAVAVAMPLLWLMERRQWKSPFGGPVRLARAHVEPRHVLGSVIFGAGWGITGACPGTALAMPFGGPALGVLVVAGMFVGQSVRERVAAREPRRASAVAADAGCALPAAATAEPAPAAVELVSRKAKIRLHSFEHPTLGDRSYLLIDELSHLAIAIDPQRDIEPYLESASHAGSRIAYALETHVHNDFISGARRLAAEHGATVVASKAAELGYPHRAVVDGETIEVGNLRIQVRATPGHTREHVSYLIQEDEPLLFSGGALVPGGAARIDLFGPEEAKILAGLAHHTIGQLLALDPRSRVLPTHAGGSFCSSGAHGPQTSTIAEERVRNRFAGLPDPAALLAAAIRDVPPAPSYYPRIRSRNRQGELAVPTVARGLDHAGLGRLMREEQLTIVDARRAADYAAGHLPGSLAIGLRGAFAPWVGWLADESRRIALVLDEASAAREATSSLAAVGRDDVLGYVIGMNGGRLPQAAVRRMSARELKGMIDPVIVDVRWDHEWSEGHIPGALHVTPDAIATGGAVGLTAEGRPVAVHCAGDYRSAIGVSLLERAGVKNLIHVSDGFGGWREAGGATTRSG
jgi:hydroxyacylglutathione hydrolase